MKIPLPSLPLGSIAGVPTGLHLSVVVLVLVIAGEAGFSPQQALFFGLAVVASLVVHLLIHLACSRLAGFDEPSREVILMPFGEMGLTRIQLAERTPGAITKAILTLLAPSIIHLASAALLYELVIAPATGPAVPFAQNSLMHLFLIQAALGLLNLLPLEPLDTGRVFRLFMPQKAGSSALSTIGLIRSGQLVTLAIGFMSLWTGPISLFFLCVMVFMASIQIVMEETALLAAAGLCAREVMRPAQRVDFFTHGVTITSALRIAQSSFQDVFPVVLQGRVVGLVDRRTLLAAAARADQEEQYVSELASPPSYVVKPETPLSEVLAASTGEGAAVVVASEGTFEGMILPNNLSDVLVVGAIRKEQPPEEPPYPPFDG